MRKHALPERPDSTYLEVFGTADHGIWLRTHGEVAQIIRAEDVKDDDAWLE